MVHVGGGSCDPLVEGFSYLFVLDSWGWELRVSDVMIHCRWPGVLRPFFVERWKESFMGISLVFLMSFRSTDHCSPDLSSYR